LGQTSRILTADRECQITQICEIYFYPSWSLLRR